MCAGGQDIPVTLRVAGGVEGGKWKSEDDVRATPSPEEEVREETVGVTEETTPSSPMYKPVLDKLEKMSDNLPDETSRETLQVVMPRLDQKDQISHQMNQHQMQMLDRIMRNTMRGRGPRPPRPGGPGKWGGGRNPRIGISPRPPQTLGANQQVLAGLSGLLEGPRHAGVRRPSEPLQNPIQFPKQPTQQPMQPEVLEEQEQQMEVLGQPKQFAGGGIVNALMATPVGQAAIQKYAEGGDITFDSYKYDYGPTGDPLKDILEGLRYNIGTDKERPARFFGSKAWLDDPSKPVVDWGPKEEDESPTLKSVRKILKPKKKKPYQPDDAVEDFDPGHPQGFTLGSKTGTFSRGVEALEGPEAGKVDGLTLSDLANILGTLGGFGLGGVAGKAFSLANTVLNPDSMARQGLRNILTDPHEPTAIASGWGGYGADYTGDAGGETIESDTGISSRGIEALEGPEVGGKTAADALAQYTNGDDSGTGVGGGGSDDSDTGYSGQEEDTGDMGTGVF